MDTFYSLREDNDKIVIHNTNECTVCGGAIQYRKPRWHYAGKTPEGLYEVELKTDHPRCRRAYDKLIEIKNKLLDAEFDLFCVRISAGKGQ